MTLTKTTTSFAQKRNLSLTIENFGEGDVLCIWELDNDCEWLCSYLCNEDGSFTYNGNIYLSDATKEELPATVKDEKHLREVLNFIAKEIK